MVCSSWVNAVFIRNDFPELGTNLISALAALDVHKLAHGSQKVASESELHGLLWYLRARERDSKIQTKVQRSFHFFNSTRSS